MLARLHPVFSFSWFSFVNASFLVLHGLRDRDGFWRWTGRRIGWRLRVLLTLWWEQLGMGVRAETPRCLQCWASAHFPVSPDMTLQSHAHPLRCCGAGMKACPVCGEGSSVDQGGTALGQQDRRGTASEVQECLSPALMWLGPHLAQRLCWEPGLLGLARLATATRSHQGGSGGLPRAQAL